MFGIAGCWPLSCGCLALQRPLYRVAFYCMISKFI